MDSRLGVLEKRSYDIEVHGHVVEAGTGVVCMVTMARVQNGSGSRPIKRACTQKIRLKRAMQKRR